MKKIIPLLLASLFLLTGIEARAQRVENASRSTIGYINSNGRIENASRSTVGYFYGERVENASRSTIGYYDTSIKPEWVAFYFFFLKR